MRQLRPKSGRFTPRHSGNGSATRTKIKRGRRCECCGARAPHVAINTDHIRSVRLYWEMRFDPENLQILCEDCNLGKGRFDQTDFRPRKSTFAVRRRGRRFGSLDNDWMTLSLDAIQRNAEFTEYDLSDTSRRAFRSGEYD